MKRSKLDILNGPIYKQILLFFFPIMLGTFFQQLYNTVDAVVVGNYVGKEALGAVGGSTGTLINLLINFIAGLAGGSTVVIAQAYGAGDFRKVKEGVRSGMFLGIGLGAILMFVGIVLTRKLLVLMNVPDEVLPYSITYMRIYLTGLVPTMIYNVGSSILRAVGDSKRPLYFLIVSCIVNIVLDITLVAVFHLGVVGVGVATVISQVASAVLVLLVLHNKEAVYHFELKEFGFEGHTLKEIVKIGLPMGMQSVLYSVSNLFIQSDVNIYGTDTVAAYTAFGKIDALYWMISGAYGHATVTIVGQCFGAGKIDRAKKATWTAVWMHGFTSIAIALVCCVLGQPLYALFTDDANVISIGMEMLLLIAPFWITFDFVEIFSSSIRACGDSIRPMIITALAICLFRVLWISFYPSETVLETLYCYPISWILASVLFLIYYLSGGWLKRCLALREMSKKEA